MSLVLLVASADEHFREMVRENLANIQNGFTGIYANMTKEAAAHVDLVNYVTNNSGKQK